MAKNVIKIELNTVVNGSNSVVNLTNDLKAVQEAMEKVNSAKSKALDFAAINYMLKDFSSLVSTAQGALGALSQAYAVQEEAERKLETVMRERMDATDEQIQQMKDLAAAQQQIGVIGDEVQLAGMQQMATFLSERDALAQLLPAMNNLAAQQKGLNVTSTDMVAVANMMGKAMQGQTSALKRVGIVFDEAQKAILETGTEMERAAVLAEVVKQNVGDMNSELAKTSSGKVKQLENAFGDLKETIGSFATKAMPWVAMGAQITTLTSGVGRLINAVKLLSITMRGALITSGIGAVIVGLTWALSALLDKTNEAQERTAKLRKEFDEFRRSVSDVSGSVAKYAAKEISDLNRLYAIAKDETKARNERLAAIRELQALYPAYFTNIDTETIKVNELKTAYEGARESILNAARARAIQDKLTENASTELDLKDQRNEAEDQYKRLLRLKLAFGVARAQALDEFKRTGKILNPMAIAMTNAGVSKFKGKTADDWFRETGLDGFEKAVNHALKTWGNEIDTIDKKTETVKKANEDLVDELEKIPKTPSTPITPPKTPKTPKAEKEELKMPDSLNTMKEINQAIEYKRKLQETASRDEYRALQTEIDQLEALKKAFMGVEEKKKEVYTPRPIGELNSVKDLTDAISYYRDLQSKQSAEEMVETQKTINLLEKKVKTLNRGLDVMKLQEQASEIGALNGADYAVKVKAIGFDSLKKTIQEIDEMLADPSLGEGMRASLQSLRNQFNTFAKDSVKGFHVFSNGWNSVKGINSGFTGLKNAITGSGTAWERTIGVVDAAISIYEGVTGVIELLNTLGIIHTGVKAAEATSEEAAAAVSLASAGEVAAASATKTIANKAEAASWIELAAAQTYAAYAWIPFAGHAIASAQVATMTAVVKALGMMAFAEGGIAFGPTVGLFGEYQGARNNPEVVAPLDKLQSMMGGGVGGKVEFVIKGHNLYGVLNNYKHKQDRI